MLGLLLIALIALTLIGSIVFAVMMQVAIMKDNKITRLHDQRMLAKLGEAK